MKWQTGSKMLIWIVIISIPVHVQATVMVGIWCRIIVGLQNMINDQCQLFVFDTMCFMCDLIYHSAIIYWSEQLHVSWIELVK